MIGIPVVLIVILLIFRAQTHRVVVPDAAMEPTLRPGDVVLVRRADFQETPPQRGIIVLVRPRAEGPYRLRRVVGVSREMVSIENEDLKIDGQTVAEPAVAKGASFSVSPIQVADGKAMLLPDNRSEQLEVADLLPELTPVPLERLMGRATRVIYPLSRWKRLD